MEDLNEYLNQLVAEASQNVGMLKARIVVLLSKNIITFKTEFSEIQDILAKRYSVHYTLSQVEEELIDLYYEQTLESKYSD